MNERVLPLLDEHATTVDAPVEALWSALSATLGRTGRRSGVDIYTRLVGCTHPSASGPRPLAKGSTIPGFLVTTVVPSRELALAGHHYFADYVLTFRLRPIGSSRSILTAESRADFPGPAGAIYRTLIVASRGHVLAVRTLLTAARRRAERTTVRAPEG